jgi:hypothetical protein
MNQKSIAVKLLLNAKSGVVRQRMPELKVVFAEPTVDLSFIGLCFGGGTLVLHGPNFMRQAHGFSPSEQVMEPREIY